MTCVADYFISCSKNACFYGSKNIFAPILTQLQHLPFFGSTMQGGSPFTAIYFCIVSCSMFCSPMLLGGSIFTAIPKYLCWLSYLHFSCSPMLIGGSLFCTPILPFFRFPRNEDSCSVKQYFAKGSNVNGFESKLQIALFILSSCFSFLGTRTAAL